VCKTRVQDEALVSANIFGPRSPHDAHRDVLRDNLTQLRRMHLTIG